MGVPVGERMLALNSVRAFPCCVSATPAGPLLFLHGLGSGGFVPITPCISPSSAGVQAFPVRKQPH